MDDMVAGAGKEEVRGMMDVEDIHVLDAVSLATGRSRWGQVAWIVRQWAREQRHVASVMHNVTKGHPHDADGGRK